ncbi:MAG: S-methyl-5-thioribose-1-phosphate isomerase, partial [Candidatus Omnitrophica bacterium]|nr:S-methyl-5-thioribose-1-phosphate isomerase [Candidatus Omnitrophota bacterium]
AKTFAPFYKEIEKCEKYLASSRPTARNLFWALERMRTLARINRNKSISAIKKLLLEEATNILQEDKAICRCIGKLGSRLIKNGDNILTHCNAGALATADFGTALASIFRAKIDRKHIHIFVDETRPVLQGARLTTWELLKEGIDTTLICDNMAASLMADGKINKIIVGADRIAQNGDVANKIGTYNLAVLAKAHDIPFYVAAPLSTFDFNITSGKNIPIELRDANEVKTIMGKYIAPRRVNVFNPAFDVTPNRLITAIITEKGIFRQPYRRSLRKLKLDHRP